MLNVAGGIPVPRLTALLFTLAGVESVCPYAAPDIPNVGDSVVFLHSVPLFAISAMLFISHAGLVFFMVLHDADIF